MNETIMEAILEHGKNTPDKLAIGFKNNTLTYAELVDAIRQAGWILKTRYGVNSGDHVMLAGLSKPDYVVALMGIQYIGAVSIPVDKSAKEASVKELYQMVQAKLILTDANIKDETIQKVSMKNFYAETLQPIPEASEFAYQKPENLDAVSEILFSTGTTGKPKGGMLSYKNIVSGTWNTWKGVGMEPSDILLLPLPLNHSFGMRELRTALYIGATIILQNGFTFAKELENNIEKYHCTALFSVPASMEVIYRQMQDQFSTVLGKLRYIEVSAGSLGYDMKKKLVKLLPNTEIYNVWGSTETGGAIFLNVSGRPDKYTSLGVPGENVKVKVVNEDGETIEAVDVDSAGRLALSGDLIMQGYYDLPEETKNTLKDGWLCTNDLVYIDEEGFIYMLGRADDVINVGGEKVSAIEVENISAEFEQIKECACIGAEDPDGILGQIPVLYYVAEEGKLDLSELKKFLSARVEKYKVPQKFIMVQELPRNRMKKVDRKVLRKMWEDNGEEELLNDVIQTILSRHSIREFTDEVIPQSKLKMIVNTGKYAPSGHNMQTWKFTVIQNPEKIAQLKAITKEAADRNNVYFYGFLNPNAVVLVSNDRRNKFAVQDSSGAAQNIQLAAWSYGIGSVWINALASVSDDEKVREFLDTLGVPKQHIIQAAIVMGYPARPAKPLAKKEDVVNWID